MRYLLMVSCLILTVRLSGAAETWYVDESVAGIPSPDGRAWATAFSTIGEAIDAATSDGGDIWIAAGVYEEALVLPSDVRLFGGFTGSETTLDQRDWTANETILDGSHAGPDGSPANNVVIMDSIQNTALDGLTITGGLADGELAGDQLPDQNGAGVFARLLDESSYIARCVFRENACSNAGGAVYVTSGALQIEECVFQENYSKFYGGALYSELVNLNLEDSTFIDNQSDNNGGALNVQSSTLDMRSCNFISSQSKKAGGALELNNYQETTHIEDCRFINNYSFYSGGAVCARNSGPVSIYRCEFGYKDLCINKCSKWFA